MDIIKILEEREECFLSSKAVKSKESKGRLKPEPDNGNLRTCFQIDRDRILHSKSFRRLKHKTQVLLHPQGDHYRTRLTHTLEVTQIARTIARALRLNEDLTEAIAMGHDLGHTPFGHAGESLLNEVCKGGFRHYIHSLRVVDVLEKNGRGLNLTYEVRDGILKHSKGKGPIIGKGAQKPETLEGQVVRISDIIAYINHDLDDALRAGVLSEKELPDFCVKELGERYSERINSMVTDVIEETLKNDLSEILISDRMLEIMGKMREFLFSHVYELDIMKKEFEKAKKILIELYEFYLNNDKIFEEDVRDFGNKEDGLTRRVCDFIAGMSDEYALYKYNEYLMPTRWRF